MANDLKYIQMSKNRTDTELLNALQLLTTGYGRGWILRDSKTGRGVRLYESSWGNATPNVRTAINNYLNEFV